MNHWIITKDLIENGASVGIRSTSYPEGLEPESLPVMFQIYDCDGTLYYEGKMSEHEFDPLDDFGTGFAGCTAIKYLENGRWVEL